MQFNDPILNLRPECGRDNEFLVELYRSTREDLVQLNLPQAMIDDLIEMQFRAQQAGYRAHFPEAQHAIIEKEGEPVGALLAHNGIDATRLLYLALLPQERNRGHGRRLLQALQSEAARANKSVTLSVSAQNIRALHLYVSCGFLAAGNDGVNVEMIWSCTASPTSVA